MSLSPIPRTGSSLSPSSSDSGAHPALGLAVQGRRRSPPPAAVQRRRAARLLPFPAVQPAGEARRHLRIAMRASPGLLRPRLAVPPRAAAAVAARARACAVAALPGGSRPLALP